MIGSEIRARAGVAVAWTVEWPGAALTGHVVRAQFRAHRHATTVDLELAVGDGLTVVDDEHIQVSLSAEQVTALAGRVLVYDVVDSDADHRSHPAGSLVVEAGVTR